MAGLDRADLRPSRELCPADKRGIRIRAAVVVADILLLPMVALIAYQITHRLGATDEAAALLTAVATVGADRLVKL